MFKIGNNWKKSRACCLAFHYFQNPPTTEATTTIFTHDEVICISFFNISLFVHNTLALWLVIELINQVFYMIILQGKKILYGHLVREKGNRERELNIFV